MSEGFSDSWFHRINRKIGSLRPVSWVSARTFHHLDPLVYQMSGERFTMVSMLGGLPVITLTTTGAKSGKKRSVPLIGIPDGDQLIIIASNWGQKHFPGWYHNLMVNPQVEISSSHINGEYVARQAAPEEYDAYWNKAVSMYGGYDAYKDRAGGREIPVIVLTPLEKA